MEEVKKTKSGKPRKKQTGEKKTRQPMSEETKAKIRESRRKRTKQPRDGQSKKSKSLYDQLKTDYGPLMKTDPKVAKWFSENEEELKTGDSMDHGILNAYEEMYISWREFKMSKIHFGKNAANIDEDLLKSDDYAFMNEDEDDCDESSEEFENEAYILDE